MRRRALIIAGSVFCGLLVAVGATPTAGAAIASLVDETFTGSTVAASSWALPSASVTDEVNRACLTASSDTAQTPIPGCGSAAGTPGLQLTQAALNQEGGLSYTSSVPSSLGLDVTFDSYQYGGTGADGIVFFLAASDPTNAHASPVTLGPSGGYLGYSANASAGVAGLTHGYLGIGLDPFGNYTNPTFAGTGCSDPTTAAVPDSITVRGPGNGTSGYCMLSTQVAAPTNSAGPQNVPVEVAVNPTDTQLTAAGNFPVPARSVVVRATPIGSGPVTETHALPDATSYVPDASWVDSHGVPQQLSFGWSASTGASTDYHVIANAHVHTLNGTPPALTVGLSDNGGTNPQSGQVVTYTATPAVTAAAETRAISLTDTFPAGLTPQSSGLGGSGWTCSINSQTVNCTHAAAAIGALPAVAMPVLVSVPAGPSVSLSDTVTVGSPDATQGNATDTRAFYPAPTATVLAFATQPVNSQVNAPMKNADATTTHIRIAADVTAGGAVDPSYFATVTLAFANNPGNAKFVVGNTTSATLTANAVNGIADFSPIVVNTVGFGYTLRATATGLTAATSTAFDVSAAATSCPAGQTCSVTVTNPSGTTQSAVVTAQPGPGTAIISATYGGNVAPIYPCTSTTGILTFSGNRAKVITITLQFKLLPTLLFCYGQPTPFTTLTLRPSTYFNPVNKDYEGLLPPCLLVPNGPCVSSLSINRNTETVVIKSGANDPHIAG